MESTEKMRENFWNTLCSISDYSVESISKLNATYTIPNTLCRFRPVNTNTLWQLQNNTQFFSTADHYDDPFDTYFKIDFRDCRVSIKQFRGCSQLEILRRLKLFYPCSMPGTLIRRFKD